MDPIFADFVNAREDIVPIAFNAWWPYSQDPFYQHNMDDNTGRIMFYGIPSVPYGRADGLLPVTTPPNETKLQDAYDARKAVPTSVSLELSGEYDEGSRELNCTVTAMTDVALPDGDFRLHVVVTESDIFFDGGNGTDHHEFIMRAMLPDFEGSAVSFSGPLPLMAEASVSTTLDALYVDENCRVVYFLQDHDTFEVHQAGFVDLLDLAGAVDVGETPSVFRLGQNYPNPFNPSTRIPLHIDREGYLRLEITDASGRRVRTLHDGAVSAGERVFQWDGRDDLGQSLASGVYLVRIGSREGPIASRRMMLLK